MSSKLDKEKLDSLFTKNTDLHGRRFVNAGRSVDNGDFITKGELDSHEVITKTVTKVTNIQGNLALKQDLSEKDQANGYVGLNSSSKISGLQQTYGTSSNTACEGNDSRITGYWTILTNGDPVSPEIIFAGGDVVNIYVP